MLMVPLPFINLSEFNAISESFGSLFFDNDHFSHIAITALGIMPFVSAYLMVEILSLFIPFLKKHRGGDYYGRNVLLKYALILTFFLSVIQGKFIMGRRCICENYQDSRISSSTYKAITIDIYSIFLVRIYQLI